MFLRFNHTTTFLSQKKTQTFNIFSKEEQTKNSNFKAKDPVHNSSAENNCWVGSTSLEIAW